MGKEKEPDSRKDTDHPAPGEGDSRRDFLRKLTYVAPVIITFQLGEEDAEGAQNSQSRGKGKAKGKYKNKRKSTSPTPKAKRVKRKRRDRDRDTGDSGDRDTGDSGDRDDDGGDRD